MAIEIRRASRQKAWLKVAVTGVTGAGKTYSSLMLSQGLAKRPLLIDTENGSGELYSHLMDYDYIRLTPPFTPAKYVEAIEAAVQNGNDFVIIDSLSHAWKYVLDYKDGLDAGNPRAGFANWRKAKKLFDETMTALLQSPIHVCACMREKSEYTETVDGRGTKTMQKTGTQPIAEPDLEFEFTVCWKIDRSHQAVATKDRTEIWDVATPFTISRRTGEQLLAWHEGGAGSLIKDANWRAGMLLDEETQGLLNEADKVLAQPSAQNINYRDIIKKWDINEREWQEFRKFAEGMNFKAGDLLVKAYLKGCRDLQDVYAKIQEAAEQKEQAKQDEAQPEHETPQRPQAVANAVVTRADGTVEGESDAPTQEQIDALNEPEPEGNDDVVSEQIGTYARHEPDPKPEVQAESQEASAQIAPQEQQASPAPVIHTTEPEPQGTATPVEPTDTAFGFKVSRMPVEGQYEKERSAAQGSLIERKMAERDVPAETVGKLLKVIANEFGCEDPNTSAAHSLVIEFLSNADEEQFDLAFAKADRNEQGGLF